MARTTSSLLECGVVISVDLIYGSNSQLRAMAEEFAADGGEEGRNDRFDLQR